MLDCLDLPKAFPRGDHLNEQVEATGFYFKRLAYYLAQDKTMHLAPLVLAESVEWTPQPPAAAAKPVMDWKQLAWIVTAVLVATISLLAFVLPRRCGSHDSAYQISGNRPASGLEKLDDLRNLEVSAESSEALKRIAESEQSERKGDT